MPRGEGTHSGNLSQARGIPLAESISAMFPQRTLSLVQTADIRYGFTAPSSQITLPPPNFAIALIHGSAVSLSRCIFAMFG